MNVCINYEWKELKTKFIQHLITSRWFEIVFFKALFFLHGEEICGEFRCIILKALESQLSLLSSTFLLHLMGFKWFSVNVGITNGCAPVSYELRGVTTRSWNVSASGLGFSYMCMWEDKRQEKIFTSTSKSHKRQSRKCHHGKLKKEVFNLKRSCICTLRGDACISKAVDKLT